MRQNCESDRVKEQMNSDDSAQASADIRETSESVTKSSESDSVLFGQTNYDNQCRTDLSDWTSSGPVTNTDSPPFDADTVINTNGDPDSKLNIGRSEGIKPNYKDIFESQNNHGCSDNTAGKTSDTGSNSQNVTISDNATKQKSSKERGFSNRTGKHRRHSKRSAELSSDSDDCLVSIPEIASTFVDDKMNFVPGTGYILQVTGGLTELLNKKKSNKNTDTDMDRSSKTTWQSLKTASNEFKEDSRKFARFVKNKLSLKKNGKKTNVKTIHILPEGDELRWARRSASSANSKTSVGTSSSLDSRTSDSQTEEVVHDLDDEFDFARS